jgi:hypothetical protein
MRFGDGDAVGVGRIIAFEGAEDGGTPAPF